MWELRLILILIGVVFIAAVYLLSRQRKRSVSESRRAAPVLEDADVQALPPAEPTPPAPAAESAAESPVETADDTKHLIVSLHVVCHEPGGFAGAEVLAALQASGLQYGRYKVFHRLAHDGSDKSVFSVANMLEPGLLEPESLPTRRIPGLTLFLLLPGPEDGVAACADMLATARALARQLGGEVLDDGRNPLTSQTAQRIRERIVGFQQLSRTGLVR